MVSDLVNILMIMFASIQFKISNNPLLLEKWLNENTINQTLELLFRASNSEPGASQFYSIAFQSFINVTIVECRSSLYRVQTQS